MSSLRVRIFVAMGLLVVAAVTVVGFLNRRVTRTGFHQFIELEERAAEDAERALSEALRRELELAYRGNEGFETAERQLSEFYSSTGESSGAILVDMAGNLVSGVGMPSDAPPAARLLEHGGIEVTWRTETAPRGETFVLRGGNPIRDAAGRQVGVLLLLPSRQDEIVTRRRDFLGSVDRGLFFGLLLVASLAVFLTALLSRRIVRPLADLAQAARALGEGDLARRVQVRSSDELGRLASAFNSMASSLERSERLRRQLVTDVAHELRTPLTALGGQIEALQDGLLEPSRETLDSLQEDVTHLSRLVSDLQDLALAEAAQLTLDTRPLCLSTEVSEAGRSLGLGPESSPVLEVHLEGLPQVEADGRRLRQILHNLLDNARTHAPAGTIRVSGREQAGQVEIEISDDGPGVDAEHLPDIFERFYRPDPSRDRATGGAGLGLAIVRELVELHRGTIRAESLPGQGLTLRFTLPQWTSRPGRARNSPASL